MNDLENKLQMALLEIERLKQENDNLRKELSKYQTASLIAETVASPQAIARSADTLHEITIHSVHQYSSPAEKINLFRNLFKGREDVYPVRWENKAGRSGDLALKK